MKLFREVNTQSDGQLQNDVDAIVYWANHWQMQFNAGKCKVVHYGKNNVACKDCKYSMCGQPLKEVKTEKHLGIVFSSNRKVETQCREAYCRASRMLGLINRVIRYNKSSATAEDGRPYDVNKRLCLHRRCLHRRCVEYLATGNFYLLA